MPTRRILVLGQPSNVQAIKSMEGRLKVHGLSLTTTEKVPKSLKLLETTNPYAVVVLNHSFGDYFGHELVKEALKKVPSRVFFAKADALTRQIVNKYRGTIKVRQEATAAVTAENVMKRLEKLVKTARKK